MSRAVCPQGEFDEQCAAAKNIFWPFRSSGDGSDMRCSGVVLSAFCANKWCEGAIVISNLGSGAVDRHFAISGDRLTITFDTTTREGVKVTRTLIWERLK